MAIKNIRFIMPILASILLFVVDYAHAEIGSTLINNIQKTINDDRIAHQMPGIQVSIIFPGDKFPHNFVSGTTHTMTSTIPVEVNHLFRINSETKTFIATTILLLESKSLITSINDPIENYLPKLPESWKKITIKQLLNHTSGLFNYVESKAWGNIESASNFHKQWTPEELIEFSAKELPYFAPGMGYHYSNTDYILATMIIEAVTGKQTQDAIRTYLFEPLHLTNTYYISSDYSNNILDRMAHGYDRFVDDEQVKDVTDVNMSMAGGAGAIISTTHDTVIFLNQLMKGLLLPSQQMNELMTLVDEENGQPISMTDKKSGDGLGIGHDSFLDDFMWGHQGGGIGYSTTMIFMQCSDITIAIAVNSHKPDTSDSVILFNDITALLKNVGFIKQCR